ncbi:MULTISPECIES: YbaB/EbfC family nucleoid-associated protein [Nocardia]|uniref:YbaB/EbfC family nucleoid-associated protein n=1 Tax=Nocardia TaxID=1817 RepID=UPI0018958650|nr:MULTISPECIES: YbaB/EbfC family nucleoid-associated protein [Nocardia]MBF6351427.1 YbaB/EbfC family nucleoid-associated protein [Nocardia flavorosea]
MAEQASVPGNEIDAVQARLVRHAERLSALRDELAAIRVAETSDGGAVTVVVDGNGALVDLTLSGAIARMPAARFERQLVAAAAAAAERAFGIQAALIDSFNNTDSFDDT